MLKIRQVQRAGVPLVAIGTADPAQTSREILSQVDEHTSVYAWDLVQGLVGANQRGEEEVQPEDTDDTQNNPVGMLWRQLRLARPGSITLMHSAHRYLDEASVVQAIWNLRDAFKADGRMLVMLGPHFTMPEELRNDVLEWQEPLPTQAQLEQVAAKTLAGIAGEVSWDPTDAQLHADAARRLKGLSAFAAEQLIALAVRRSGLDAEYLDMQARQIVAQTPGLAFETGHETFDDVGGQEFAKQFGQRLFAGPRRPAVVVRMEELEKTMAGAAGDLSGTSSDALQVILSEMEDNGWSGMLAYGAPGAGKSLFAKSLANTHDAKAIRFDLNATKGSLVGQSEQRVRQAMRVIHAIGGSDVFFVASVNRLETLPPELQRRFRCGVWFFDIPGAAELEEIWELNEQRFGLRGLRRPNLQNLTGADVRNLCEVAYALGISPEEAQQYVVPLAKQSPKAIGEARQQAHGRFIDAAHGGAYELTRQTLTRKVAVDNEVAGG